MVECHSFEPTIVVELSLNGCFNILRATAMGLVYLLRRLAVYFLEFGALMKLFECYAFEPTVVVKLLLNGCVTLLVMTVMDLAYLRRGLTLL